MLLFSPSYSTQNSLLFFFPFHQKCLLFLSLCTKTGRESLLKSHIGSLTRPQRESCLLITLFWVMERFLGACWTVKHNLRDWFTLIDNTQNSPEAWKENEIIQVCRLPWLQATQDSLATQMQVKSDICIFQKLGWCPETNNMEASFVFITTVTMIHRAELAPGRAPLAGRFFRELPGKQWPVTILERCKVEASPLFCRALTTRPGEALQLQVLKKTIVATSFLRVVNQKTSPESVPRSTA